MSYEMIFTGTGVEIHASKNTVHMNCDVYIDDVKVGELAAQNAGAMHKQKLFEKKILRIQSIRFVSFRKREKALKAK